MGDEFDLAWHFRIKLSEITRNLYLHTTTTTTTVHGHEQRMSMLVAFKHVTRSFRLRPRHTRGASQWIERCPEARCGCRSTPDGLEIDRDSKMTFSPYRQHIVVCTGQNDWASKIELDVNTSPLTRHLKALLGPQGKRSKAANGIIPGKFHNVSFEDI